MRAAIYTRVSTDEQAREGASLDTQEERCRALVTERNDRVMQVFKEEGYSGSRIDRPALDQLREFVKGGKCDCVIAYDTDRLARKLALLGMLEYEFERAGVAIHYVNTPDDPLARMVKGLVGE